MKRSEDSFLSGDLIAEPQLCSVCAQLTHKVTLIAEPRLTGCVVKALTLGDHCAIPQLTSRSSIRSIEDYL